MTLKLHNLYLSTLFISQIAFAQQGDIVGARVSKISECGAITLAMGILASKTGNASQEAEMKKFALAWGNTAMAIGKKEGYSKDAVIAENKRQVKIISSNFAGFADVAKTKMDDCTNFLKTDPEVLQAFRIAAN